MLEVWAGANQEKGIRVLPDNRKVISITKGAKEFGNGNSVSNRARSSLPVRQGRIQQVGVGAGAEPTGWWRVGAETTAPSLVVIGLVPSTVWDCQVFSTVKEYTARGKLGFKLRVVVAGM